MTRLACLLAWGLALVHAPSALSAIDMSSLSRLVSIRLALATTQLKLRVTWCLLVTESLAVIIYQLSQICQVINNVDATSSVQLCWLEEPEVESTEVTQWHGKLEDVLLQEHRAAAHFLIDAQKLLVCLLFLPLLFLVLNDQTALVGVEILEDEAICKLRIELYRLCRVALLFLRTW